MQDETKNTIYLAISLIIAAITLGAIGFVLYVRGDYANTRYDELYAQKRAETNRKFSLYNNNTDLSGAEVVALLRNYYMDGSIDIYVDKDKFGNSFLLDGTTRNLDYTLYANKQKVSISMASASGGDMAYINVKTALDKVDNYIFAEKAIASIVNGTDKYESYLIYDGASVQNIGNAGIMNNNSIVTGIYVKRK